MEGLRSHVAGQCLGGERLAGKLGNQRWIALYAESANQYVAKAVDAELEFHKDAQGKVDSAILRQNGRDTTMPRLAE